MSFLTVYILSMILSLLSLWTIVFVAREDGQIFDTELLVAILLLVVASFVPILNVMIAAILFAVGAFVVAERAGVIDKILEWLNRGQ